MRKLLLSNATLLLNKKMLGYVRCMIAVPLTDIK